MNSVMDEIEQDAEPVELSPEMREAIETEMRYMVQLVGQEVRGLMSTVLISMQLQISVATEKIVRQMKEPDTKAIDKVLNRETMKHSE